MRYGIGTVARFRNRDIRNTHLLFEKAKVDALAFTFQGDCPVFHMESVCRVTDLRVVGSDLDRYDEQVAYLSITCKNAFGNKSAGTSKIRFHALVG